MATLLAEPRMVTLDDLLGAVLDRLGDGRGAPCLVCGEPAFAIHARSASVSLACRSCGSALEELKRHGELTTRRASHVVDARPVEQFR